MWALRMYCLWSRVLNTCPFIIWGPPGGTVGKDPTCQYRRCKRLGFDSWSGRSPGGGNGTPVFLPENFHGQRSLAGCSPWGCRVGHSWAAEHTYTFIIHLPIYLSVCLHTMQHNRSFPGGLAAMYYMNVRRFLKLLTWATCTPQLNRV